tara:strand:- start:453 stop:668 length:216 start_codon:yes stop_codon:yes gene_type:complete
MTVIKINWPLRGVTDLFILLKISILKNNISSEWCYEKNHVNGFKDFKEPGGNIVKKMGCDFSQPILLKWSG